MKNWKGYLLLALGVVGGTILVGVIRLIAYKAANVQPNMAPEIYFVFAPVLAMPILVGSIIVHVLFSKYFDYKTGSAWFFSGLSYASFLLYLISDLLLIVPILTNPALVLFLRRKFGQGTH
jgi:hypothetical protein